MAAKARKSKKVAGKAGRPSSYTPELADRIVELLTEQSLRKICSAPGMPARQTVTRWQEEREDFASRCAKARIEQADYMDDLILDTAHACTAANANAARVKISAFQWRASKLKPRKYGDRLDLNVAGQEGSPPVQTVTAITTDPLEAARVYQDLIAKK